MQPGSSAARTPPDLLRRAREGDRAAFDALARHEEPPLRALLRRIVGVPADVDDVLQRTWIRAWQSLTSFRGEASLGTWLHSIAARQAIDFLRSRKRYRAGALVFAQDECVQSGDVRHVLSTLAAPDFHFDVHEHIAYCFACVGRSLMPEQQAALVLRDVYGHSNDEAARMLGLSRSVFRHHLADARKTMMERYDRLCALVSKTGVCYQCEGLRDGAREAQRGLEPREVFGEPRGSTEDAFRVRLRIVRDADLGEGRSRALHELLFRKTDEVEHARPDEADLDVIPAPETSCSDPP